MDAVVAAALLVAKALRLARPVLGAGDEEGELACDEVSAACPSWSWVDVTGGMATGVQKEGLGRAPTLPLACTPNWPAVRTFVQSSAAAFSCTNYRHP